MRALFLFAILVLPFKATHTMPLTRLILIQVARSAACPLLYLRDSCTQSLKQSSTASL